MFLSITLVSLVFFVFYAVFSARRMRKSIPKQELLRTPTKLAIDRHLPFCLSNIVYEYQRDLTTTDAIKCYMIMASPKHFRAEMLKNSPSQFDRYRDIGLVHGYVRSSDVTDWLAIAGGHSSFFWPRYFPRQYDHTDDPESESKSEPDIYTTLFDEIWIRARRPQTRQQQRFSNYYLVNKVNGTYDILRKCQRCPTLFNHNEMECNSDKKCQGSSNKCILCKSCLM